MIVLLFTMSWGAHPRLSDATLRGSFIQSLLNNVTYATVSPELW